VPGDAIKGTLFLIRHPQNCDSLSVSCHDDEMFTVRLLNFLGGALLNIECVALTYLIVFMKLRFMLKFESCDVG